MKIVFMNRYQIFAIFILLYNFELHQFFIETFANLFTLCVQCWHFSFIECGIFIGIVQEDDFWIVFAWSFQSYCNGHCLLTILLEARVSWQHVQQCSTAERPNLAAHRHALQRCSRLLEFCKAESFRECFSVK